MKGMKYIIVGLGNPEPEYSGTRHNIGREVVKAFAENELFSEWEKRKEYAALVCHGSVGDSEVMLVMPDNYMNNSGLSIKKICADYDREAELVVVQDDIDRPLGELHLGYNRGSGGHRGVQSIIDQLGTKQFSRVRIGIAPTTFFGKMRKPKGERAVQRYVVGAFSQREREKVQPGVAAAIEALITLIQEGRDRAMNKHN